MSSRALEKEREAYAVSLATDRANVSSFLHLQENEKESTSRAIERKKEREREEHRMKRKDNKRRM